MIKAKLEKPCDDYYFVSDNPINVGDMYYNAIMEVHMIVIERNENAENWWSCYVLEWNEIREYATSDFRFKYIQKVA